jgi:hypothetical protein
MNPSSWPRGIPPLDDPAFCALGSKDSLCETIRDESDPVRRSTAIRALVALEIATPRRDGRSERLSHILETIAIDPNQPNLVREAAVTGLPFVSIERARAVLPSLLGGAPLRAKAIDLLEAIHFLEKCAAAMPSERALGANHALGELRSYLTGRIFELVADPATSPEERMRGQVILLSDGERLKTRA